MDLDDLEIYRSAMSIGESVWSLVADWPYFAKDTVGKQLVRSADSIAANISEGFGRYHFAENRKFCFYSRGSLRETITWIDKSEKRDLIASEAAARLRIELTNLRHRLDAYIKSIGPRTA